MALEITCEEHFGEGTRTFHFANVEDPETDESIYSAGLARERSLLQSGSLGQEIFARLSHARAAEPPVLEEV